MNTVNVLKLQGPSSDGPNIGTAIDGRGLEYVWEGDVRNRYPHGYGVKTITGGLYIGSVGYGEYKDGEWYGEIVATINNGTLAYYNNNNWKFVDSLAPHQAIIDLAKSRAIVARKLVHQPWSRKTNHFNKFKSFQASIKVVLLCSERLRRVSLLEPLPLELWEYILYWFVSEAESEHAKNTDLLGKDSVL
eukprot:m.36512 g.36512  ORF g.36512 m.36512 type:complete len:190 (+) comp9132_c0_seq2:200-769(+)